MASQIEFKKIGIVGGVAWPSTVTYYSEICRRAEQMYLERDPTGVPAIPEMVIESLDLSKAVSYIGKDGDESSWRQFDEYHRTALKNLQTCGAEVAAIASNTPHHRFEAITEGIGIPVINIVEATAKQCLLADVRQVLILGTAVTMNSSSFREVFANYGIQATGPQDRGAQLKIAELIAELQMGRAQDAAKRLENVAKGTFRLHCKGRPVVCLACTELPLAFEGQQTQPLIQSEEVLYINTTAVHIDAILESAGKRQMHRQVDHSGTEGLWCGGSR